LSELDLAEVNTSEIAGVQRERRRRGNWEEGSEGGICLIILFFI